MPHFDELVVNNGVILDIILELIKMLKVLICYGISVREIDRYTLPCTGSNIYVQKLNRLDRILNRKESLSIFPVEMHGKLKN